MYGVNDVTDICRGTIVKSTINTPLPVKNDCTSIIETQYSDDDWGEGSSDTMLSKPDNVDTFCFNFKFKLNFNFNFTRNPAVLWVGRHNAVPKGP